MASSVWLTFGSELHLWRIEKSRPLDWSSQGEEEYPWRRRGRVTPPCLALTDGRLTAVHVFVEFVFSSTCVLAEEAHYGKKADMYRGVYMLFFFITVATTLSFH